MEEILYLMWNPHGWAVYSQTTTPDPAAFPDYWYKRYNVDMGRWKEVFDKLLGIRDKLVSDDIMPSEENYNEIFPELENLL